MTWIPKKHKNLELKDPPAPMLGLFPEFYQFFDAFPVGRNN